MIALCSSPKEDLGKESLVLSQAIHWVLLLHAFAFPVGYILFTVNLECSDRTSSSEKLPKVLAIFDILIVAQPRSFAFNASGPIANLNCLLRTFWALGCYRKQLKASLAARSVTLSSLLYGAVEAGVPLGITVSLIEPSSVWRNFSLLINWNTFSDVSTFFRLPKWAHFGSRTCFTFCKLTSMVLPTPGKDEC